MATALQKLEQRGERRGEQRGVQLGMQQERQNIAKNMLAKGADLQFIKETTNLSDEEISQLH